MDEIPSQYKIVEAKFEFAFPSPESAPPKVRVVTIRPPNTALFVRNEDSFRIEKWLRKRGFVEFLVRKNRDAA